MDVKLDDQISTKGNWGAGILYISCREIGQVKINLFLPS
jgi:hypothetical protein